MCAYPHAQNKGKGSEGVQFLEAGVWLQQKLSRILRMIMTTISAGGFMTSDDNDRSCHTQTAHELSCWPGFNPRVIHVDWLWENDKERFL